VTVAPLVGTHPQSLNTLEVGQRNFQPVCLKRVDLHGKGFVSENVMLIIYAHGTSKYAHPHESIPRVPTVAFAEQKTGHIFACQLDLGSRDQ
jgi:hypothetical protein